MAPTKVDFKRELRELYGAKRAPAMVDVPELGFLMVDGNANPNTSQEYGVQALYAVAYAAGLRSSGPASSTTA